MSQSRGATDYYIPTFYHSKRKFWLDPSELGLTLLSLCWFFFGTYVVCIANAYLDQSNPSLQLEIERRVRLPDPLLEYLAPIYARLKLPTDLADTLVRIAPVFFFVRSALMGNKTLLVLRRLFYILGASYLLRTPFVLMTVLPNPLKTCISHPDPHLLYDALLLMAQRRSSCGDVLFSGHTIMFMLAALAWVDYPLGNPLLTRITSGFASLFCGLGILVLIGSTYHYTVDCVIGVIVVLILWRGYHFVVTTHYCDDTWYSNFLNFCDGERQILSLHPELGYELCGESYV